MRNLAAKMVVEGGKSVCLLALLFCAACTTVDSTLASSAAGPALRDYWNDGYAFFLALVQETPYRATPPELFEKSNSGRRSIRAFVYPSFRTMLMIEATEYRDINGSGATLTVRTYDTEQNNKELPADTDLSTFIGRSVVEFRGASLSAEEFSAIFNVVEESGFLSEDLATRERRWPLRDDFSELCLDGTSYWIEAQQNELVHYISRGRCSNGYQEVFALFAKPLFDLTSRKLPMFSKLLSETSGYVSANKFEEGVGS
jgi:hypothetical protein